MTAGPGEIVLRDATREFVPGERGRTLKARFVRRRRAAHGGGDVVRALDGVTLSIGRGETVGLIGRNGAGKSSTLRTLAGIVPLTRGEWAAGGRVVALLELGAGFGRDFTGRENIALNAALHGLGKREVAERLDRIIEFSELGAFIDRPVRTYSQGMTLRLGFAIAAHLDPDVLLIDEVLAVGDEAFQRKCLRRIGEQIEAGTTVVLVSHDAGSIERVCARTVVLDRGRVVFDGPTAEAILRYHALLGPGLGDRAFARAGTDAIAVGELVLRGAAGEREPLRVLHTGAPLVVEVPVRARDAIPAARAVLEVFSDGRRVFRTEAAPALPAGESVVRFAIDAIGLLGGDYDVAVAISEGRAGEEPGFDRVAGFSVAHELDREGIADLAGAWSVAGVPAGEVAR